MPLLNSSLELLTFTISHSLPDDDRDICVFDYYVDESGEWDPWQSRVPEAGYSDSLNMLGDVFVDTVETVSVFHLRIYHHFKSCQWMKSLKSL